MGYARLDVYWHDGRLESYILDKDTVSVGRASGNHIALDTDTISRYHFSIVRDEHGVTITDLDSANGTFVDGVQLKSNEPHLLAGVEEIQIGHLRMIYHAMDENPTLPITPLDETQRIEHATANFGIELDMGAIDVWPAASTSTQLIITNHSEHDMTFNIGVDGMPAKWVRLNRGSLFVPAGEASEALINIKTPRRPDVQPISYQATIQVQPQENPTDMLEVPLQVNIKTYRGFGMALADTIIDIGESLRLYVHNQGNASLQLKLRGYAPDDALRFRFSQSNLTLTAGQRAQVLISVHANQRNFIGREAFHRFDIHAQSQDDAHFLAVESGKVLVKPRLPAWGVVSLGGMALSVVMIMALALLGLLTPAPAPNLLNFSASASEVQQGETIELSWQATQIGALDLVANGTPVVTLNGDATAYTFQTEGYQGDVTLQLIGTRGEVRLTQSLNAFVIVPMQVTQFEVVPSPLMRNVVTAIEVNWEVQNAVRTRIEGLDAFTTAPYRAEHGATGALQGISGYAERALSLTLYAYDEQDNALEIPLIVDVLDPSCTARLKVALREGPDVAYQQVGTVPAEQAIIVQAQDASSGWLLTTLPGDVRAWGERDAFICSDSFDPQDLRKEFNLPPTPTPEPTATATPEPTAPPTATTQP